MIKTRDDIEKLYRKAYPDLEEHYCIIMNEDFLIPTVEELTVMLNKHSVTNIKHVKNISDCEKLAWFLVNGIHRERAENSNNLPSEQLYTWSIGWLTGIQYGLLGETPHTIATALTNEGIKNIEPKTNLISKVDTTKFNALLLVM